MYVQSFPPIVDKEARILIAGTAPSVKSLEKHQFYGHPQNYFWRIMYGLLAEADRKSTGPNESYEDRIAFLQQCHIALWDVIATCKRQGSLDANIKEEEPNDIPFLLDQYPAIRCLAFNGTKAYSTFKRYFSNYISSRSITLLQLPSSSPIPTKYMRSLEDRLAAWSVLLPYLQDDSESAVEK